MNGLIACAKLLVSAFFAGIKNANSKTKVRDGGRQFIEFALAKLPVVVTDRGAKAPLVPAVQSEKELALRGQWAADKLAEKKDAGEDTTAKLARQVIDGFLYFQSRLNEQGSPESIDELMRLRDNCQELIQDHLALFMSLSAQGRNLHPIFNERIQRPYEFTRLDF